MRHAIEEIGGQWRDVEISLVIPAYNESARLPVSLERLHAFLERRPWQCEIVVVVEPGTDDTLEVASKLAREMPRVRILAPSVHRGKGGAVREGMLSARGALRFFMDADLSTDPEALDRFVARFSLAPDVSILIGSRQHPESRIPVAQNGIRSSMGQIFNRIVQTAAFSGFRDTQCGFKAFRAEAAEAIFSRQQTEGFAFDVEVLLLAKRLGFRIEEMPVIWENSEASKVRVIRDSLAMFWDVLRARKLVNRTLNDS